MINIWLLFHIKLTFILEFNAQCTKFNEIVPSVCMSCEWLNPDGSCLSICPLGYYQEPATSICQPCLSGCVQCTDEKTCVKCSSDLMDPNRSCMVACGEYMIETNGSCSCITGYRLDLRTSKCLSKG